MPSFLSNVERFRGTGTVNEKGQTLDTFLEHYDAEKYRKPSVTADILVFAYQPEQDNLLNGLKLLMVKRRNHPSIGFWALPGGFAEMKEDLIDTARRELEEETSLKNIPLAQLFTYGEEDRDPRDRLITTAYIALIEAGTVRAKAGDDAKDAKWWDIKVSLVNRKVTDEKEEKEYKLLLMTEGEEALTATVIETVRLDTVLKISDFQIKESCGIAFDHAKFILQGYTYIDRSTKNEWKREPQPVLETSECKKTESIQKREIERENPSLPWYENAAFYHIYPLGLCGAPKLNEGHEVTERFDKLLPWISHIKKIGCNAIYLGPVFESVGHGYETTDYKTVDRRLGTNESFKQYVNACHEQGIRVVLDGVFNHTGREFFAFKDLKENREQSSYRDWYCNVNFNGNNEYNDGFSYDNWGGYNLLVRLNQKNPAVKEYILNVIRYWVDEFDIDGIRLDAADVLEFEFMKEIRRLANHIKDQFWVMGEVIHGDYGRWVNDEMLHSVTNYQLHKALFSGHNDHNYFEIAHNIKYVHNLVNDKITGLYNFLDNHDVDRIASKVVNKENLVPIYYLLYTLPGVPSIYYGSEFSIEGVKANGSDDGLRPALDLDSLVEAHKKDKLLYEITKLGQLRQESEVLARGRYEELLLTNRQFAFGRYLEREAIITVVNNDEQDICVTIPIRMEGKGAKNLFSGEETAIENGTIRITLEKNSGRVFRVRG